MKALIWMIIVGCYAIVYASVPAVTNVKAQCSILVQQGCSESGQIL